MLEIFASGSSSAAAARLFWLRTFELSARGRDVLDRALALGLIE